MSKEDQSPEEEIGPEEPFSIVTPAIRKALKLKLINANGALLHSQMRLWMNKDRGDKSWAGIDKIADELGLSRSTVKRQAKKLESLGFIHRTFREGSSTIVRALEEPGYWKMAWGGMPELVAKTGKAWLELSNQELPTTQVKMNRGGVQKEPGGGSKRTPISNTYKDPLQENQLLTSENEDVSSAPAKDDKSEVIEIRGQQVEVKKIHKTAASVRLAAYMAECMEAHDGNAPKINGSWVSQMHLLATQGPTTWANKKPIAEEAIADVIRRVTSDPFHAPNVRSPGKLRKRWDNLALVSQTSRTSTRPQPSGPSWKAEWRNLQALISTEGGVVEVLSRVDDLVEDPGVRAALKGSSNLRYQLKQGTGDSPMFAFKDALSAVDRAALVS